jgi:hypothetical protein
MQLSIDLMVQGIGCSPKAQDPENRADDLDIESQFVPGCNSPVSRVNVVKDRRAIVNLSRHFPSKFPTITPAEMSSTMR